MLDFLLDGRGFVLDLGVFDLDVAVFLLDGLMLEALIVLHGNDGRSVILGILLDGDKGGGTW